ncbi:metalloregulator ArsR/SmtB family transcription factor [Clostridium sp. KNHs216]|uniref:ArsR/SmtB family transcription factor n=1 Tax=Clostridium sp. KNHs216 TaxID=1550235 RepID=UPI00114E9AC4|nr:metalloregulator ArsR/SmtB family transcription factor [Clostridium sp. KNHs216]TQI66029.1 ArsR family transcriptional regulator [Clostridium sp. KNHs216]
MVSERDEDALCSCTVIHEDIVRKVKGELAEDTQLVKIAELFKAMSDPTRLKIINALILSEMCVCDLACLLKMTQPAISHHLKTLRQTQLIKYRRDGKIVYYSLDDAHIAPLFQQGYEHISEK